MIRKAAVATQESKATMTIPSKQDRVGDSFDDNSFHVIFYKSFFPVTATVTPPSNDLSVILFPIPSILDRYK